MKLSLLPLEQPQRGSPLSSRSVGIFQEPFIGHLTSLHLTGSVSHPCMMREGRCLVLCPVPWRTLQSSSLQNSCIQGMICSLKRFTISQFSDLHCCPRPPRRKEKAPQGFVVPISGPDTRISVDQEVTWMRVYLSWQPSGASTNRK